MKGRTQVETGAPVEVPFNARLDAPVVSGICFMQASELNVSVNFLCLCAVRASCNHGWMAKERQTILYRPPKVLFEK